MGAREDQIARIQQIERIRSLEAGSAVPSLGSENGPTEPAAPTNTDSLLHKGVQVLGKIGGVGRAIEAPLVAAATSAYAGKPTVTAEEMLNGVNPTNLKSFPTAPEMMKRAGIPDSPPLSAAFDKIPDHVPGKLGLAAMLAKHFYADPNSDAA